MTHAALFTGSPGLDPRDLWVRAQVVADLSDLPLVARIRRALQELND